METEKHLQSAQNLEAVNLQVEYSEFMEARKIICNHP